jgi:hypothetical protein
MTYGNFAESKIEKGSKRREDVLLTALERCEQLEERLVEACRLIGKLNIKLREKEDFIKMLRLARWK